MTTKQLKLILVGLAASSLLSAQTPQQPARIYAFDAIRVQKPVLIDSIDIKRKAFSEDMLLNSPISIPTQSRFTTELSADTAGFFRMEKPQSGQVLRLASFFVSGNQYGKAKLKVTSPNPFELWVDGKKSGQKTERSDSLHQAGNVETTLDGFTNNVRVVVKLLASAQDKLAPAFKVELTPEKDEKGLAYTFNNTHERRINIKDILEGKRVNGSSISASGRYVMLSLGETLPGGKYVGRSEILDTKTNTRSYFDTAQRSQIRWMPKSDKLSFISESENGQTLYAFDPATNATTLLAEELPKESFMFAPDEKSLFFSKREKIEGNNPEGLKRMMGIDDRIDSYRNRYFIYRYFLDSGLTQQLTFGQQSASINDVSTDCKLMLFSVGKEDLSERPFRSSSLYLLNLESMKVDTIWSNERFVYSGQFSPDNKKIIIHAAPEAFGGIGLNIKPGQIANSYDTQSYIMDLATRHIQPVTKNFDPTISSQQWSPVDNYIYYTVEDKDRVCVYRYSPKKNSFDKLPLREDVIRSFDLATNGNWATYTGVSVSNSNRSYLLNLKTLESKLIADPYADRLNQLTLGDVKDWTFTSSYGDVIDGRYYLPPNFDPNKKYPLIVYYYGGTSPTTRIFESTYPLHVYAAQDYVVYALQPSGTTGYGQEFAARHVNAWGKQTADEIIEGVKKFVAAHNFVDGTKIGNIGASYGGFMTQYLITQTDLFTASVSHAGISNIASYWGEGFWGYSYSSGASAGSYPWNNPDMYVNQSPLFNADKITTPLLLLHGNADTNVPMGESIQMYNALKLLGKEVEFIQVDGENHAIYQYDKRIGWNNSIYAWFAKWLKGDSRWWDSMYSDK